MRLNICKVVSILAVLLMIAIFYPSIGLSGPLSFSEFSYSDFYREDNISYLDRGWGNSWGIFMERRVQATWPPGEEAGDIRIDLGVSFTSTSQVRVQILVETFTWDPYSSSHNWPAGVEGYLDVEGDYPFLRIFGVYDISKPSGGFDGILGPGVFDMDFYGSCGAYGSSGAEEMLYIGFDIDAVPVPEPATMLLLGSGLIGLAGYGRKKFFKK